MRNSGREWVGGRVAMPAYVLEPEPFRPDLVLWVELPEGPIVWTEVVEPRTAVSFADCLRAAMTKPMIGSPRMPARVRVADPALAEELRASHPQIAVTVAPTPELDAIVAAMARDMPRDDDDSYLDGGVSPDAVARLFRSAKLLWRIAPWKLADDDAVLRVDVPAFGVEGACLSIIGALGETFGFLLFPSFDGYEAFLSAADRHAVDGRCDLGTTILSLTFARAGDLPPSMRREVARHGWPVADAAAYPHLEHRDRDGVLRPQSDRDLALAAAVATSLTSFFVKHGDLLHDEEIEPLSESWYDENDLEVRFTVPYEAYPWFAVEEPPPRRPDEGGLKVGRNAPCPCGSGAKYKKCCLASSGPPPAGRIDLHELDRRLVLDMSRYAERRFGAAWLDATDAFADAASAFQLALPWSVYVFQVEGRPIVDWFLVESSGRLRSSEREWLESQRRAWLGVWEVTGVDSGRGVTVRDLLSGETRQVEEISGSRTLVLRDTVLGRVVDHDGVSLFCGIHQRPLPPLTAAEVVRRARARVRRKADVPIARLRGEAFGRYLIARWEEAVSEIDDRRRIPPTLCNHDGELLLFTTDHFAFEPSSRDELLARLGGLTTIERSDDVGDEAVFVFVRASSANGLGHENTVLGSVGVAGAELRLETNSVSRADDLRCRLESACGDLVGHRAREHTDPLALLGRGADHAPDSTIFPVDADQLVREYKQQHYAGWLDEPLPALHGMTPRAAARTRADRERLDVLLKDMENREALLPAGAQFDFSHLRRQLGLAF